jgi:cephalosporin hydroxylase
VIDLSVIIPARNERDLQRTIESVLGAIEADTEIIAVPDGYWPDPPIVDHPRVTLIHHTESRGQRQSINEAARIARGKYLMKLDAHCAVGPGFDRILIEDWQPGWTLVPTMFNLDIETFTPKLHKKTTAMYVGITEGRVLRAEYYGHQPKHDTPIHETMCCMGPGWFLSKDDFWKQGGCDEGHGSWGQQGVEVALKAWLSGGALMTDERTWFAHWFRGGGGPGFPYPIGGREVEAAREYSRNLWLNNAWPGQVRTLEWLVRKFEPPGWEGYEFAPTEIPLMIDQDKRREVNQYLYEHLHIQHHHPKWRGVVVVKLPTDMALYHRVIWETKPEIIVEIGTFHGGSALFLQDMLDLLGEGGKVVTVNIRDQARVHDPRITYLLGDSKSAPIREQIAALTAGKRTMVILDGDHRRTQVKWELHYYADLVSPGCYLVVEDCLTMEGKLYGPGQARDWFLSTRAGKAFQQTNLDREHLVGVNIGGWLRRRG